jgi:D-alanine-D-alanine ligase
VRKLKVLVLHYQNDREPADGVATQVQQALQTGGHEVLTCGVFREVSEIESAVVREKPDIVFNLVETFNEDARLEANVAAVLELMGQPFTGAGMVGLTLAQDKVLTKMVMASHGVSAPSSFGVYYPDRVEGQGGEPRFPAVVKPSSLDASMGIDRDAVVRDWESLLDRVRYVQDTFAEPALVEEFIDGREFYAGVIGNGKLLSLPVLEMSFRGYDKGEAKIVTNDAKWNQESEEFKKTTLVVPKRFNAQLEASIQKLARQAFRACHLRDYGRVDLRVRRGKPFVLEVNANPYLDRTAEIATAAKEINIDYDAVVNQILERAWLRYHPEEQAAPAVEPRSA